jgi:hypothetical protein
VSIYCTVPALPTGEYEFIAVEVLDSATVPHATDHGLLRFEILSHHRGLARPPQSGSRCYIADWYGSAGFCFTLHQYVVDVLMRDRPAKFLVYLGLAAEQQRRGKAGSISYQQLAESVGVSRSSAQAAAGWLARRRLVVIARTGFTAAPSYAAQRPWLLSQHPTTERGEPG